MSLKAEGFPPILLLALFENHKCSVTITREVFKTLYLRRRILNSILGLTGSHCWVLD